MEILNFVLTANKIFKYLQLCFQTLFTWVFLVTLRQYLREKKMQRPTDGQKNDAERSAIVLTSITRPIVRAFRRGMNRF